MQPAVDERSLGELFSELAQETRILVSQELELAKTEMSEKATKIGKGAGFAAAGGFVIYAGLLSVILGIVVLLAETMPLWVAALLVGVIVALIGYLVMKKGMNDVKSASLKPEKTIAGLREDKEWVQDQVR